MSVTQAHIDALNEAIASGTRQVTIGGQTILYQTTASLIQARDDLEAKLRKHADLLEGKRRSRQTVVVHAGRGFLGSNE